MWLKGQTLRKRLYLLYPNNIAKGGTRLSRALIMTILLADDEERIIDINKRFLESKGYKIITARDGNSALAKVQDNSFYIDVCVLDVMMPGIDGYTLCRQIKDKFPEKKVIILTAKGDDDAQIAAFEANADDYIPKPYSLEVLLKRIERLFPHNTTSKEKSLYFDKIKINPEAMTAYVDGKKINLSATEFRILQELLMRQLNVVSETSLLKHVEGGTLMGLNKVIYKLRAKLNDQGEHLVRVRGEGYKISW